VIVVIGLAAVITARAPGRTGTSPAGGTSSAPAGLAPKFMVMVVEPAHAKPGMSSSVDVQVAATGQELATVKSPAGTSWSAVASTGDNQTFVLAANPLHGPHVGWTCSSSLHQLRLTASGRVAGLASLNVPTVAGGIFAGDLRASADGQTVAYAASTCPQNAAGKEVIGVISTATGHATQWTMPARWFMGGSISLSADGSLIGLGVPNAADAASNFRPSGPEPGVWVLRASSPPGTVTQRGREVVKISRSTPLGPVALSADGTQVYVNTHVSLSPKQNGDDLAVYGVSTGARLRMVRAGWHSLVSVMSTDPGTGHAVFWDVYSPSPIEMDLATGKITALSPDVPPHAPIDDVAW
jgi:hypothetical protein